MKYGLPLATQNQSIGLFGGSFDPPHQGHVLVAKRALKRARLDQIWWIPSPGNPLKSRQPAPMSARISAIQTLITHPKMRVCDIETQLNTRYTIDTLTKLQSLYPSVHFVLIFGSDILSEMHRWHQWDKLAHAAPICVIARPQEQIRAGLSPFAQRFAQYRLEPEDAPLLSRAQAPAWTILPGPMLDISSTELRQQNGRP